MIAFRHHSRLLCFRRPQGAVPCGTVVRLAADVSSDTGICDVTLRLFFENAPEQRIPMAHSGGQVYADAVMPQTPCLVWYSFEITDGGGQRASYGAGSGEGTLCAGEPPRYQITVYDGAFDTPAWAREGTAYQIFPDRFKRSSWEDFRGRAQYHTGLGRFLRIHDRWSEEVCSEPSPGDKYYTPDDFFGGDLNGIREKLPYLASLGITILYLNPVFESPSNHRYNTADYLCIDPILGNEEEFAALCAEARTHGIRIMLDGVFSHTGADSRYFDKFHRYAGDGAYESESSPYAPWYTFTRFPDAYECWWNFPTLPNVKELEPSYTEFIAGDDGVLRHWANRGATSWRLDVADELPDEFIRILRKRMKANDPDALLMGEVWEDCSTKYGPKGRRGYVGGDELDCAMNYPFTDAVIAFLTGKIDAYGLNDRLQTLREHYPRPFYEACFNLLSSHDIVRAATALSGAPDRNALNRAQQANYAPCFEDAQRGKRRLIEAAALQVSVPGVPCVYYGDEAGMTGMADPFNRAPYPWGSEDPVVYADYTALLRARRDTPALQHGLCRMGALSQDVFAVLRYTADNASASLTLINRSEQAQNVSFCPDCLAEGPDAEAPVSFLRPVTDVFSGETYAAGDTLAVTLPPLTAKILLG